MRRALRYASRFSLCTVVLIAQAQGPATVTARMHNNRGSALMTQQKFEAALLEFKAASAVVNQGIALLALGRLDEAAKAFEQVLAADHDNIRARYNIALVYRAQGKLDEALSQLLNVQRIDSNDSYTAYFIASIQFQRGSYADAAENYQKAIDLDPTLASAFFGASRAFTALNQPDRARVYQDRFQTLTRDSSLNSTIGNQYGEQGVYGLVEEADVASDGPNTNIVVQFADVSARYGIQTIGGPACLIDFDRDGVLDLFIRDSLYRNRNRRFEKIATLQPASSCAVGDFDNDDYPDLFITTARDGVLYRNNKGRFEALNIGLTGASEGTAFIDLDHDGWLDLVVGNRVFRNKADGTFSQLSLPAPYAPTTIVPTDHDNDRDIDVLVTTGESAIILSNNRDGTFTRKDILPDLTRGSRSVAVVDFDKDGWMDLFFSRLGRPPLLLRNSPAQRFTPVELPVPETVIANSGVNAVDFDNDGFIDLVFPVRQDSRYALRLLRNLGSGKFQDVSATTQLDRLNIAYPPQEILVSDIDGDGDSDLIVTRVLAPPIVLQNNGGSRNHSLKVTLKGLKDNKTAIGTKVEIHGAALKQKVEVANAAPILFGLGSDRADFVRMLWPTGVVQDELPGNRSRVEYQELDRKGSSCPTLYSWDGRNFRFITDIIGPGVIGEWESPGQWNASDTDEYVRLQATDALPINGRYRFKILSQMEEVTYLDALKLVAIDTPAGVDVYNNDRYQPIPPYPDFKLWQVREAHKPVSVVDDQGRDVSKEVADIDGIYAPVPKIENYPGFARLHSLVIDVGEVPSSRKAQLILSGYTDYFDSTTAHSAYYSGIEPIIPSLEVADGKGGWVRKIESIGVPAGLPKTIIVDLTGMFPGSDHRVRITNNMEIYWDRILINTFDGAGPSRVTTLLPKEATLGFAGYPLELRKHPETYDYNQRARQDAFQWHQGNYTRYGDVTALMTAPDDMYAIMASGDEVTVDFDANALPPLPAGWHRTLLAYADGYEKAMETYTPFPATVAPLPFHGMTKFPYPVTEHYPDDPAHLRYQLEYNTRHISLSAPVRPLYMRLR